MNIENQKIFECVVGSNLYGTNTTNSDKDFSGIFIADEDYYFGIKNKNEIDLSEKSKLDSGKNSKDAIDRKFYEIRNFCILASDANPNIIEHLFINDENILYSNDLSTKLLNNSNLFVSKKIYNTFIGYSKSQEHKMIIKLENFDQLVAAQKFFENQDPNEYIVMFRDDDNVKNFFTEKGSHFVIGDLNFQKHLMVKRVLSSLNERLRGITNRSELVLKHGYDTKFASHLIRLLLEGKELMETSRIEFPLKYSSFILDIKLGKYTLNEVINYATEFESEFNYIYTNSKLPDVSDIFEINNLVKTITKQFFGVK